MRHASAKARFVDCDVDTKAAITALARAQLKPQARRCCRPWKAIKPESRPEARAQAQLGPAFPLLL